MLPHFLDNFFAVISLPIARYKLGTLITGTVCRNRKYLSQAFRNRFQIGEEIFQERFSTCLSHAGKEISTWFSFVIVYI
jgi:hypothetical protein